MNKQQTINEISRFVCIEQTGEGTGHDWWHTERVVKCAKYLAEKEGGDIFVVELAALLHDIADFKFNDGDEKAGSRVASKIMSGFGVDDETIAEVCIIIDSVSYKGEGQANKMESLEGKIVQDADRLDALGAIGIARVFAYGGKVGREIYNPEEKPKKDMDFETYKNNNSPSINHFYEKLLLIKDRMNTETARKIAKDRHNFLLGYLNEFYKEWEFNYPE